MTHLMSDNDFFGAARNREYPSTDDPEAAYYGLGAQEPLHWVDADGVPDPREGTLSPFTFRYIPPVRQTKHHSLLPWLAVALIILLALPILKVVLTVLAVLSFVVVVILGLGFLTLFLALFVTAFVLARRMHSLSRRMYL